jgi:hypothetical protein
MSYLSFNPIETPIIADLILRNYKRDKSYFEHFSPKFNNNFLVKFEEKVDSLVDLTRLQVYELEITEKIRVIINHFRPLINITAAMLLNAPYFKNLPVIKLGLNRLTESLNRRHPWEIQKNCLKLISELESCIEEFIDKGFILKVLTEFHLLLERLSNCESKLADLSHQRIFKSDEYHKTNAQIYNQLEDFVKTIIESTPAVFRGNNIEKRSDYSIEKLMAQSRFIQSEYH